MFSKYLTLLINKIAKESMEQIYKTVLPLTKYSTFMCIIQETGTSGCLTLLIEVFT